MNKQTSKVGWIAAVIVVVIIVAVGTYLARKAGPSRPRESAAAVTGSTAVTGNETDAVEHPIEQADLAPAPASTVALPALDGSDDSVTSALAALTGDSGLSSLLMQPQVIQRIVATVDSLPRRGLNMVMLPLRTPKGSFATEDAPGGKVMSSQNDARYAPYMEVVQNTETKDLVAWYVHAYPLFQQAYRELGYPKAYFNDRVIVAIDDLLAAPDLEQRPALVLANGYYRYADPRLESLSAGQRAMLRTGPENEAKLKTRLRQIRSRLVGRDLHGNTSARAGPSAG